MKPLLFNPVATVPEFPMKKVALALVFALSLVGVVGCGGATATTKPTGSAK
jgi:hypothetical protein